MWLDYYARNPDWFDAAVTRITSDQLREEVRFYEYTADQLAFIREQVS